MAAAPPPLDERKIISENRKKLFVAAVLTVQVTAMVLTLRYSKTTTNYVSSTAVVMAEGVKMLICLTVLTWQHGAGVFAHLNQEIFAKPRELLLISPPALLYLLQNNLLFFAGEKLEAALYQVTYQLKTLTTALCMVLLLGKRLSRQQWFALVILSIGVAMAQFQPPSGAAADDAGAASQAVGLIALIIACFTSGFAGVYTEKLLKQTQASLWVRNIQLATWSLAVGFFGIYTQDAQRVADGGFFQGYNRTVWCVVLLQAASGIVVALVIKLADNIIKNFAVAMSILLATVISVPLFGFHPTGWFVGGATLVLFSVHLYTGGSMPGIYLLFEVCGQGAAGPGRTGVAPSRSPRGSTGAPVVIQVAVDAPAALLSAHLTVAELRALLRGRGVDPDAERLADRAALAARLAATPPSPMV